MTHPDQYPYTPPTPEVCGPFFNKVMARTDEYRAMPICCIVCGKIINTGYLCAFHEERSEKARRLRDD